MSVTACKRKVRRKVDVSGQAPRGVKDTIVVTIYPSGRIGLRELRCRREYIVSVAMLYRRQVVLEAMAESGIGRRRD